MVATEADAVAGRPGLSRQLVWGLATSVGCLLVLLSQGTITSVDGMAQFDTTRSIVDHHSLAIPPSLDTSLGMHGHFYSWYAIGLPLISLLPYLLGKFLGLLAGHSNEFELFAVSCLTPVFAAFSVVEMTRLGHRLGASTRTAVIVALGAVFGTFLLPYTKDFFSEPAVILALLCCLDLALAHRDVGSGAALGIAALIRPQIFLVAPVLAFLWFRRMGWQGAVRASGPVGVAAAMTAAANQARFGSITNFGYAGQRFDGNLLADTWRLLISPYKGLVLFAPLIVLVPVAARAVWRAHPDVVAVLACLFAETFVLDAAWGAWQGGWCWGPRLLLAGAAPILVVLGPWIDGSRRRLAMFGVLAAAGFAVSAAAMVVPMESQLRDVHPTGPQIIRQLEITPGIAAYTLSHFEREVNPVKGQSQRFVDLWQVGLVRSVGRSKGLPIGAAGSLLLMLGLGLGVRELRRGWASAGPGPG